jgi:GTP cyclohydrolase I
MSPGRMEKLKQSRDLSCAHCGGTVGLQTLSISDSNGTLYEVTLCEEDVREFRREVGGLVGKFVAHPVIREGVVLILKGLHELYGLDLNQEDLKNTPERVARMYAELCAGLGQDPAEFLKVQFPAPKPSNLIVTRRIEFDSVCVHHLAPMTGYAYIGYVPEETAVGLSKLGRVVEAYARRPQLQERMTNEICDCVNTALKPKGVIVLVTAQHDCMCTRGIMKRQAETVTSAVRGIFLTNDFGCKDEFFNIVKM